MFALVLLPACCTGYEETTTTYGTTVQGFGAATRGDEILVPFAQTNLFGVVDNEVAFVDPMQSLVATTELGVFPPTGGAISLVPGKTSLLSIEGGSVATIIGPGNSQTTFAQDGGPDNFGAVFDGEAYELAWLIGTEIYLQTFEETGEPSAVVSIGRVASTDAGIFVTAGTLPGRFNVIVGAHGVDVFSFGPRQPVRHVTLPDATCLGGAALLAGKLRILSCGVSYDLDPDDPAAPRTETPWLAQPVSLLAASDTGLLLADPSMSNLGGAVVMAADYTLTPFELPGEAGFVAATTPTQWISSDGSWFGVITDGSATPPAVKLLRFDGSGGATSLEVGEDSDSSTTHDCSGT